VRNVFFCSVTTSMRLRLSEQPVVKLLICAWSKTLILSLQMDWCARGQSSQKGQQGQARGGGGGGG